MGPVGDHPPGFSQGPPGWGILRLPEEPRDYNLDRLHMSLEQNQDNQTFSTSEENGSDIQQAL